MAIYESSFSYVATDKKLPYIKSTNNSGEKLGQEIHVLVAGPSTSTPNALSGVHYEGTAVRNEDGTLTCNREKYKEGSPALLSPGGMSPSSAKIDEGMDVEFENCGKKFNESIASMIKSIAKEDKREEVADLLRTFWSILTSVMSLSLFQRNSDHIFQFYTTKSNELLEKASDLYQSLKYPPLTRKTPVVFGQEENAALQVDWYAFLRNVISHLSKATKNKCKIEELERDLREEIGVLRGLDAEMMYPDITFSKDQAKEDAECKMQQAAQALFHIEDPSLFENLLKNIWKNQEPYIKSLEDEIAEKQSLQQVVRSSQRR